MCKKLSFILVLMSAVFMFSGCGNGSCTVTKSYGTNSFTKDAANTCVKKLAGATCYENSSKEDIANIVAGLQKYELVFNKKKCYDFYEKDESDNYKRVECPDIIPEKIKISQLSGCNIYYDGDNEHTDCITPCPDIYFSTDNDLFKTVAYKDDWGDLAWFSQSADGKASFSSSLDYQKARHTIFSWHEAAEDGTEIRKSVRIDMKIIDSATVESEENKVLAQCEDNEGRIYHEGDLISDKCGALICSENGWDTYYNTECYVSCDPNGGVVEIRYWTCPDGSDLEWCFCEEDEEYGSKLRCVKRIDLQCPEE
jgi:hypothetical protein